MATPPDGSSSWFHHSDTFSLVNPDGRTWLAVIVLVSGRQLDVMAPELRDPHSLSCVARLSVDDRAHVTCELPYAGTGAGRVAWSADTPPESLLPRERRVRVRTASFVSALDGPVVAEVHAEIGGRLWFTDMDGRIRLELRLDREGAPSPRGMTHLAAMTREGAPSVDVRQSRRVERAEVAGRTLSAAEFLERIVAPPPLGPPGRRLVLDAARLLASPEALRR